MGHDDSGEVDALAVPAEDSSVTAAMAGTSAAAAVPRARRADSQLNLFRPRRALSSDFSAVIRSGARRDGAGELVVVLGVAADAGDGVAPGSAAIAPTIQRYLDGNIGPAAP